MDVLRSQTQLSVHEHRQDGNGMEAGAASGEEMKAEDSEGLFQAG